jgi:dolichol-phosphate mannosyltransferase
MIMLGVIGEYLGRVYDEVRQRPLYVVSTRVGISGSGVVMPSAEISKAELEA